MINRPSVTLVSLIALVTLLPNQSARADAIDGSWCFKGRHLAIEGPKMLTPGGKSINGDYDRHGFTYKAPVGEKEAGSMVFIASIDDDFMEFRVGSEQSDPQVWRRCAAPTS